MYPPGVKKRPFNDFFLRRGEIEGGEGALHQTEMSNFYYQGPYDNDNLKTKSTFFYPKKKFRL